jgi:DNA-binding CsgD family transcriptional regulator
MRRPTGSQRLSPRERVVLEMVSTGLTNAEVARRLGVSVHAVKFHLAAIYRKLEVGNRTEAAILFVRSNGNLAGGDEPGAGIDSMQEVD